MFQSHKVSAVINCAGKGTRFGANKLLVSIDGSTILERTVRAFNIPLIDEIVVTVSEENEETYRQILVDQAGLPVKMVLGDKLRHLSALNGLNATTGDIVVVHDGVRPFVTEDLIGEVVAQAVEHGAAMLGMPSTVQVKLVDESGYVTGSLERSHSWLGQTPQAFRTELLAKAYHAAIDSGSEAISDDADLVAEFTDHPVRIVRGHVNNIKITTPQDLGTARLIASHQIEEENGG